MVDIRMYGRVLHTPACPSEMLVLNLIDAFSIMFDIRDDDCHMICHDRTLFCRCIAMMAAMTTHTPNVLA